MASRTIPVCFCFAVVTLLAWPAQVHAQIQNESRWVVDLGVGFSPSINGNINSGAIGTLNGQATAILPNSYGDVYGTGTSLRFGGGYALNAVSEVRGVFVWQTADANLVRMGDYGTSPLYAQYSDYKSIGLDLGYRRYWPLAGAKVRPYGEVLAGIAFVDRINAQLAAPQTNTIFASTDFYDSSGAMTFALNFGALVRVADHIDLNGELGIRRVGGLSDVDQFVGTGLDTINNDTSRMTFPLTFGVRLRF
jgi:hypothetical protein